MEDGIPIMFISLSMGPSSREVGFVSPVSAPGWSRLPSPITPVPIAFIAVPLPAQCGVGLRVLDRSIRPIWRRFDAVMSDDGEFVARVLRLLSSSSQRSVCRGIWLRNRLPPFAIFLSLFPPFPSLYLRKKDLYVYGALYRFHVTES